jgi:3-oxoacyl-[acyl-carrier protein] reductase
MTDERTVIVTGAGGGIGRAITLRLAAAGYSVVCGDSNQATCEETVRLIRTDGGEAIAVPVDVSGGASVAAFVNAAADLGKTIYGLVHCAAVWQGKGIESITEEEWDGLMGVNLKGTFLITRAIVPHLKKSGCGRIVLLGSQAGRNGGVWSGSHYSASKGGVLAFTRSVAQELGPFGITVNAVSPGVIATPMTAGWPSEVVARLIGKTPLGRLGQPGDVAGSVLFLLSDEARFITGETIEVNGGLLMD